MNLLVALDALLETNSVTQAAERLHTSAPAMSRTLARLRRVLGDPLLVRAGRNLVPTPRALELRYEVSVLVAQGRTLLTPRGGLDPTTLKRSFAVQAGDIVLGELATPLLAAVRAQAPGVTLHFLPDSREGTAALRDGRVDIEVGVIDHTDPETTVQRVLRDRMIGVAAPEHPLITDRVTVARFAAAAHLSISRRGRGPIDDRLALHGRTRRVVATVPNLTTALLAVRSGTLICPAPAALTATTRTALGLRAFEIPVPLPEITIAMAWHPRNTADTGHRWLRELIRTTLTDLPLSD
ncbi:LysR family transcriptional regulator [Nocardia sp. NBC_00565]|uniref:LysR family transcriptional regulator n=1 Tax=Nocardia sp. NBC_00565 TaxID=2975993 RepID=UPI002E8147A5|nr:LysR family transcriptional regulator [Nocardia sp. NBC_00565]WUC07273.1 LysR family transcriptional regulator [Nocardia sp. NBC_00565]